MYRLRRSLDELRNVAARVLALAVFLVFAGAVSDSLAQNYDLDSIPGVVGTPPSNIEISVASNDKVYITLPSALPGMDVHAKRDLGVSLGYDAGARVGRYCHPNYDVAIT